MTASPLDRVAWPVRTERLTISRATAVHAEPVWRYRRLEVVNHWITAAPPSFEAFKTRFVEPVGLANTLVIEVGGEVIGDLMIAVEDAWAQAEVQDRARGAQAELGWALDPDHGGAGLATEAVQALLDLCFGTLGLHRVTAQCFADNAASRRLMERVGMRLESELVGDALHRSGRWMDTAGYALLADEWPSPGPAAG